MNQDEHIGPINIGNPNEFTMLDLAKKIIRLTASKSKLIHLPLPKELAVKTDGFVSGCRTDRQTRWSSRALWNGSGKPK